MIDTMVGKLKETVAEHHPEQYEGVEEDGECHEWSAWCPGALVFGLTPRPFMSC